MKKSRIFLWSAVFFISSVSLVGCAATPTQEGTGEYFDDSVITTKVKSAILNDSKLKSNEISVKTSKGVVRLRGYVSSQAKVSEAIRISSEVPGVKAVENELYVKNNMTPGVTKTESGQ